MKNGKMHDDPADTVSQSTTDLRSLAAGAHMVSRRLRVGADDPNAQEAALLARAGAEMLRQAQVKLAESGAVPKEVINDDTVPIRLPSQAA